LGNPEVVAAERSREPPGRVKVNLPGSGSISPNVCHLEDVRFAKYGSKSYSCPVATATSENARVFASKNFMRFARRFRASQQDLWDAMQEKPDADLGGNIFKFRLARRGEGSSGGARAIVAMKVGQRIVLMYGFEKKDMGNIQPDELKQFKASAKIYLGFSEEQISDLVRKRVLTEIKSEPENRP
jgi:hypothetical protein